MKSRNILKLALFFSITFFTFAAAVFLISLAVEGKSTFSAAPPKKKAAGVSAEEQRLLNYGSEKESIGNANVFDPENRVIAFTEVAVGVRTEGEKSEKATVEDISFYLDNPGKCPLLQDFQLAGTAQAIPESDSSVTVSKARGKEAGSVVATMGEEVDEGVIVVGIRRHLAVFQTRSGLKCLGEGVGTDKGGSVKRPAKSSFVKKDTGAEDVNIRKIGDNTYAISRQEINKATTNLTSLASQARIVPSRKHNGFKIYSIRQGSLYRKIGLQNGDVIKSINGVELSSPDKALQAYQRLRNAERLSLDIIRRGKKETMEYIIE